MKQALWAQLGITPWQIFALAVGTTVLFWVFTLLISFFGQQMRARVTITTFAIMSMIGSVTARAMLGPSPTMSGGILVLVILFFWEGVYRLVGRRLPRGLVPVRQARVVLRDGVIDHAALRRTHVRPSDLIVRLRQSGVTRLTEATYAIVETDGSITVIPAGQTIDAEFLADVVGIDPGPAC